MFNTVSQICQDYYNQLPPDTLKQCGKSALYSFTVSYFLAPVRLGPQVNFASILFATKIATLASLIYALTEPLFKKLFGNNRVILHRELAKHCVNASLVSLLVNYLTQEKVNLFAFNLFASFSCNILLSACELIPALCDVAQEPFIAQSIRRSFRNMGLNAVPGSSSIFINFGPVL